jgi:hypothetical protein
VVASSQNEMYVWCVSRKMRIEDQEIICMYMNNYNIFGCGYKIRAAPEIKS